jgi:hypothetical protein
MNITYADNGWTVFVNEDIKTLSEQWLSIHKRWPFEDMENRVLHRIAFDYSKIYTN